MAKIDNPVNVGMTKCTYNMVRPVPVYKDVVDASGQIVRKVEWQMRDYTKPFTPQDGEETFIGDIGHMVRTGVQLEHTTCYLSKLGSGNPFDLSIIENRMRSRVDEAEKAYAKEGDSSKKNE